MKKIYFIVMLGLLILGGAGIFVSGQKRFSANENRYLTTAEQVKGTENIEDWLTDQFAGRDLWLSLSSSCRYAVGAREIDDTYIGRDGYLFDACAQWDFPLASYVKNLEYVKSFSESYPVTVDVVLVPSSYTVLEELLPSQANAYDADEAYEAAETILSGETFGTAESGTGIRFYDMRDRLRALSQTTQVYYRTDHHWTTRAAFDCYAVLHESRTGETISESEAELTTVSTDFYGTLYSRVQLPWLRPDTIEALPSEVNDETKLSEKDQYAYFLGGNTARADYEGTGEGSLLVIKDSYANCLVPFMLEDYAAVTVIDLRYYNLPVSELMDEGFDRALVLYEMSNFASETNIYKLLR